MIRKTAVALLVALVASFALSSPADAAPKKSTRARAKQSGRGTTAATAAKPAAKKKAAGKKATTKKPAAKKAPPKGKRTKRTPTTKPR